MGTVRADIVLPEDLAEQIDSLVGRSGRNAFLVETARAEVRRRRLQEFLKSDVVVMRDEDHPELAAMGTEAWVRKLRSEWEPRQQRVLDALESSE